MRYLIDGYNLMYAGGLVPPRLGPDGLRRVRTRFLNDLADALGAIDSHQTTVVFDAADAPDFPHETSHQGLSVVFSVDDENADARIELLIARHATPKALTVVSTDRRVRQAATRRKALSVTAESFWVELDARKERRKTAPSTRPALSERPAHRELSAQESAYWLEQFGHLENQPETKKALGDDNNPMISEADIAKIEREVERETERL
jgi:uncharacterized protein